MLTPDPSSNDGHGRYPATDSTAALERDAFIIGLKQRLPEELRESFTDQQLEGLRSAFATRSWARHKIDLRGTFSFWSNQYYFVLVGGRNKRSLSRAQRNLSLAAKAGAITLFLFFSVLVGLVVLYLLKSALGINLLPNYSLGLWDWFKGQ
ncbi:3-phosphoshikimate 1-carboxyvinyltransferase [Stutzerimonas sp. VN223-3]|uniref:3-phosphoshikimate 1-carboxyvinyltransferase n=1 Tax=Stutzerimonas TaxID=2901164 RepID=UPI00210A1B84|nr:3-phosphoshikimate 1-carboxyvinyltransferase [Stutzerimonas stutzeri]MCQ4310611.1 3-phosphoshikimate 1-carboxyvinyltransferase [Stutzerimonas stutzeri]